MAASSSAAKKGENGESASGQKGAKRNALGRGLSALMTPSVSASVLAEQRGESRSFDGEQKRPLRGLEDLSLSKIADLDDQPMEGALFHLPIERLEPNTDQPRTHFAEDELAALAQSIAESGMLQPILVRKKANENAHLATYEIVAGERRWRAAKIAELATVPVLIKQLTDKETLAIGIVENVQRANLNPIEEALAYKRLIDEFGETQSEVAKTVGKDRATIANALRLLQLPEAVLEQISSGALSAGHGRALLGIAGEELQRSLAEQIIREQLSVREVERIAKEGSPKTVTKKKSTATKSPSVLEVESRLRRALGTKVKLAMSKGGKGELKISFYSNDELQNILDKIGA